MSRVKGEISLLTFLKTRFYNQYKKYKNKLLLKLGHGSSLTQEYWDNSYKEEKWNYFQDIDQLGRFSIVAGYVERLKPKRTLLEVGCGKGLLIERLHQDKYSKYIGIDISKEAIKRASTKANEKTIFLNIEGSNFVTEERFDAIIIVETLYYFEDPVQMLQYYEQFLKDDGLFIISMYRHGKKPLGIWKRIESIYTVVDSTVIINKKGHIFDCKALMK